MTTIAFDGKSIVADGLEVSGTIITSYKKRKLYRVEGAVIGCAGASFDAPAFVEWYEEKLKGTEMEYPSLTENFVALVVDHEGKCQRYFESSKYPCYVDPPYAIGTGGDIAMGAMFAGESAREAILIATLHDVYSGGEISEYTVHDLQADIPSPPPVLDENAIICQMSATLRRVDVVRAEEEAALKESTADEGNS